MNKIGQPNDEPLPKRPKLLGEDIPSTSHQQDATSAQSNDWQPIICEICTQQYKDPRLLDCLHSFCRRCIDKPEVFKTSIEKGNIIRCPVCYQDTEVPPGGLSGLDKDFVAAELVKEQAIKKQLSAQDPQIPCESCNEHHFAIAHCKDCNDFLCITCTKAHQRLSKMKGHSVVTLAVLQSGRVSLKRKKVDNKGKCKNHAEQDLCMFCSTCQEMVCLMCTVLTHCRPDHEVSDIKTAETSCRTEIMEVLKPKERDIKALQVAKISVDQAKERLESTVNEVLDKIASKRKGEIAKLGRRAKTLKDKALAVAKERGEALEKCLTVANTNATEAEYILKKVTSIVSDGDCHDIISLKKKVLKNLRRVSVKKAENVPLDLTFMDFTESSAGGNNLGELLFKEEWTLKEEFGSNSIPACNFEWAKAVVSCSNGDIVVLDSGATRVITFSSNGGQKGTLSSTDARGILVTPRDIALSSSKNIWVLDKVLKVFNKEGQFTSRMVLPEGDTLAKCIDAGSGVIAIGMKEKILLFKEDGSNPISIPAKQIDKHIAICNKTQSLIYTNYEMSRLISVDFSGRENFNVSITINGEPVKPTGVCTNKNGDIYIAMHTGLNRGTGQIHHYSPQGCYIGFVATALYNPLGLDFNPVGELIVADRHSVKVFHKV